MGTPPSSTTSTGGPATATLSGSLFGYLAGIPDYTTAPKKSDHTTHARSDALNTLESDSQTLAFAALAAVMTVAVTKLWLVGFSMGRGGSGADIVDGFTKPLLAVALILLWPWLYHQGVTFANQASWGVMHASVVGNALKSMEGTVAGVAGDATLITLSLVQPSALLAWIVAVVSALGLILVMAVKISLTIATVVLYVTMPVFLMLWPIEGAAWLTQSAVRILITCFVVPLIWAFLIAVFAIIGVDPLIGINDGFLNDLVLRPLVVCVLASAMWWVPRSLLRGAVSAAGVSHSGFIRRTLTVAGGNAISRGPMAWLASQFRRPAGPGRDGGPAAPPPDASGPPGRPPTSPAPGEGGPAPLGYTPPSTGGPRGPFYGPGGPAVGPDETVPIWRRGRPLIERTRSAPERVVPASRDNRPPPGPPRRGGSPTRPANNGTPESRHRSNGVPAESGQAGAGVGGSAPDGEVRDGAGVDNLDSAAVEAEAARMRDMSQPTPGQVLHAYNALDPQRQWDVWDAHQASDGRIRRSMARLALDPRLPTPMQDHVQTLGASSIDTRRDVLWEPTSPRPQAQIEPKTVAPAPPPPLPPSPPPANWFG